MASVVAQFDTVDGFDEKTGEVFIAHEITKEAPPVSVLDQMIASFDIAIDRTIESCKRSKKISRKIRKQK